MCLVRGLSGPTACLVLRLRVVISVGIRYLYCRSGYMGPGCNIQIHFVSGVVLLSLLMLPLSAGPVTLRVCTGSWILTVKLGASSNSQG